MATHLQYFCENCMIWLLGSEVDNHLDNNHSHIISEKMRYVAEGEQYHDISLVETPPPPPILPLTNNTIQLNRFTKNKSYTTISKIVYLGTNEVGPIIEVGLISYMDEGVTSYDVRVVDRNNESVVICEVLELTNTEGEIFKISDISNLPETKTMLDIQVRKNGGLRRKQVCIESILIKY